MIVAIPLAHSPIAAIVAWVTFLRDGRIASETAVREVDGRVAAARGAVPIRLDVSLADLAPGDYICQVTVLDSHAQRATFWRAVVTIE